jgi:DNA-binding transcriptional regulator YhcF (GntR family)
MKKMTQADLAAQEESRRNSEWLRQLAERAYDDLERSGKLTIKRPSRSFPARTKSQMAADRDRARANTEWLRQLAEKGQAELDRKKREAEAADSS